MRLFFKTCKFIFGGGYAVQHNLQIVQSQILKYLFVFDHIQKYLVYRYLDLTSLISDEYVFGPIRLFKLFELDFDE